MYMYTHDYRMVSGYEDSLGDIVFEVEPAFEMDSVKLTALEMDSLSESNRRYRFYRIYILFNKSQKYGIQI